MKDEYKYIAAVYAVLVIGYLLRTGYYTYIISNDLTKEFLYSLYLKQNKKCTITGRDIFLAKNIKEYKKNTASLDRIDSKKGYNKKNVQWVHKNINIMKWDFDIKYFIELCILVAKNN